MRQTIWVSLARLKQHEFNRTLRLTHNDPSDFISKLEVVSNIYNAAVRQFIKLSGALLTAYLILNSLGTDTSLALQVGSISVSVPKAYYLTVCSIIFLMTLIALNHLVVSLFLRISATLNVRIAGFSAEAFRMIQGEDEMSLGNPVFQNHFLKERLPVTGMLSSLVLLCLLSLLIPICAFGAFGGSMLFQLFVQGEINILEKISSLMGLAIFMISYFYFALFYMPLPYRKNVSFIRWTVLHNLPRAYPEEQIARWTSKSQEPR